MYLQFDHSVNACKFEQLNSIFFFSSCRASGQARTGACTFVFFISCLSCYYLLFADFAIFLFPWITRLFLRHAILVLLKSCCCYFLEWSMLRQIFVINSTVKNVVSVLALQDHVTWARISTTKTSFGTYWLMKNVWFQRWLIFNWLIIKNCLDDNEAYIIAHESISPSGTTTEQPQKYDRIK